jgi:hypothetical protein
MPDLRHNHHAESRFCLALKRACPDADEDSLSACWDELCDLAERDPMAAARFERQLRRDGHVTLDS